MLTDAVESFPASGGSGFAVTGSDLGHQLHGDTGGSNRSPVSASTWWDLASLTKVLVTTPLVIAAFNDTTLDPSITLADLGFVQGGPVSTADAESLLTHTSGAPPELALESSDVDHALATSQFSEPGSVVYSDVGFIALGRMLELSTGTSFAQLAHHHVAGLEAAHQVRFGSAPGENWAESDPALKGLVHDPVARQAGGLLGHAGVFATIEGAAKLAQWWVDRLDYDHNVGQAVSTRSRPASGGNRGWGWALQGDDYACAPGWPTSTASHTGFTGTAVALDPESHRCVVLLSNAVSRGDHAALRWLRSAMAELAPRQQDESRDGTVW